MAVTGQLWYLGQGDPTDGRVAYINNDNTNHTVFIDNSPTTTLGTGFPQHIAIDWAAGLYYVISNGGPAGTNASVLMGHLGSAAAPTVVFTWPNNDGDQTGAPNSDIVNTIQIDPYSHHLYIGLCDYNGDTPSFQGVRDFTYNTTTGAITAVGTNGGYLFTQTQAQVQSSQASGTDVTDPFDFAIDPDTDFLFFTQLLVSNGFEHNSLWRIDLNNPTAAAFQLVPQAQFPLDVTVPSSTARTASSTTSRSIAAPTWSISPPSRCSRSASPATTPPTTTSISSARPRTDRPMRPR